MNEHSSGTRATVPPSATLGGTPLLDLQMTIICAEAMGYEYNVLEPAGAPFVYCAGTGPGVYAPLKNDKQAMALLKRFPMDVFADRGNPFWRVRLAADHNKGYGLADDLNRAIVECVAMLQIDGTAPETSTVAQQNKQEGVPDQGSVRNATDELDAKRYRWLRSTGNDGHLRAAFMRGYTYLDDAVDAGMADAAIRALPVLEDVVTELIKERDSYT